MNSHVPFTQFLPEVSKVVPGDDGLFPAKKSKKKSNLQIDPAIHISTLR